MKSKMDRKKSQEPKRGANQKTKANGKGAKPKAKSEQKPVDDTPQLRPAVERMYRAFQMIKKGNYPSATEIAKEIEATTRTVWDDITFMRERLNIPLDYDEVKHGYYFTRPVGNFPIMEVTDADVQALAFARNLIELFPHSSLEQPMKDLYETAVATLDNRRKHALELLRKSIHFQPFGIDVVDPKSFEIVIAALWEQRVLQYEYRKPRGTFGLRRVHPWAITEHKGAWYVVGFCEDARAKRTFLLSRLRNPELLRAKYTVPESFNAKKHFDKCFGVQGGDGDFKVVVKQSPLLADIYRTRSWHSSQVREELEDGSALLTFRVSSLVEIKYCILGWAEGATVIEPPQLVAEIRDSLKNTLANYEGKAEDKNHPPSS